MLVFAEKNPIVARINGNKKIRIKQKPRTLEHRIKLSRSKLGHLNPRWTGGENPPHYLFWSQDRKLAFNEHKMRYKKGLHVHHINPYKSSKDSSLSNLKTLCVGCHLKEEAKSKKQNFL